MSATFTNRPVDVSTDETTPGPAGHRVVSQPTRRGRRWPIAGAIGGGAGLAAVFAAMSTNQITEEEANTGVAAVELLDRAGYHAGFVLGLVSVGALLVASSGWKRWAEARAPQDLAGRTIGQGLALTATVTTIFACFMGALALYLPGGTDHGWQPNEQLYITWSMLDFGIMLAWWGAAASAVCVAVLALRRERLLPRWMGVVSVVLLLPGTLLAVFTALPGFVGLTMPIWLVVISIGMATSKHPGTAS